MKKLFLAILMIPVIASVFALDVDVVWKNDLYRWGLGNNMDDGLTGGLDIGVSDFAGPFSIDFSGYSYTNRGFNRGTELVQSRTDLMNLSVGYSQSFISDGGTIVDVKLSLGVDVVGNLGLAKIQDIIHENMTYSYHLGLPYPDETYVSPSMKASMDVYYGIGDSVFSLVSRSDLRVGGFESSLKEDIGVSLADCLYLKGGFSLVVPDISDPTSVVNALMTEGATLSFGLDAGGFRTGYTWYPFSFRGNGCGYISVSPMEFFGRSAWNGSDFSVRPSMHYEYGRKGYANTAEYGLDGTFSVVLKETYSTGFPLMLTDGGEWDWNGNLLQKKWTIVSVDGRASYGFCDWFEVYGEAGIGLGVFDLSMQTYTSDGVFDGASGQVVVGMLDVCGGATLLPEGLVTSGNATFQLDVYGGVNVDLSGGMVSGLFGMFGTDLAHDFVEPYFGFGIKVGIDA